MLVVKSLHRKKCSPSLAHSVPKISIVWIKNPTHSKEAARCFVKSIAKVQQSELPGSAQLSQPDPGMPLSASVTNYTLFAACPCATGWDLPHCLQQLPDHTSAWPLDVPMTEDIEQPTSTRSWRCSYHMPSYFTQRGLWMPESNLHRLMSLCRQDTLMTEYFIHCSKNLR